MNISFVITMIKNKWIIIQLILSTYYIIIFAFNMNQKRILYGRAIIGLDGKLHIPVFMPISWLIHDIHSAKMMGQKEAPQEMMTSDMTPDENGNYKRNVILNRNPIYFNTMQGQDIPKEINNRNSKIDEYSKKNRIINKNEFINKPIIFHKQENRDFLKDAEMRIVSEQKWLARKKLTDEILSKHSKWPTVTDKPIFTSVEVYDIPGINKYMGLASNLTVVHKAPDSQITANFHQNYKKLHK